MVKKSGEISRIAWADKMTKEEMESFVQKEKDKMSKMSEISLSLTTYNDIFSSFDPRPYTQRALSDDFLDELRKAVAVKNSESIELKLLMPASKRNLGEESAIKKRLKDYFKRHEVLEKKELGKIVKRSIFFMVIGVLFMLFATYISFKYSDQGFLSNFLVILFEPGGWFFFWQGLYEIVVDTREKAPESQFLKKMAAGSISFYSY